MGEEMGFVSLLSHLGTLPSRFSGFFPPPSFHPERGIYYRLYHPEQIVPRLTSRKTSLLSLCYRTLAHPSHRGPNFQQVKQGIGPAV